MVWLILVGKGSIVLRNICAVVRELISQRAKMFSIFKRKCFTSSQELFTSRQEVSDHKFFTCIILEYSAKSWIIVKFVKLVYITISKYIHFHLNNFSPIFEVVYFWVWEIYDDNFRTRHIHQSTRQQKTEIIQKFKVITLQ